MTGMAPSGDTRGSALISGLRVIQRVASAGQTFATEIAMEKAFSASDGPVRATGVVEWLVESGLGGCEVPTSSPGWGVG